MKKTDENNELYAKIGARLNTLIDESGYSHAELVRELDKQYGYNYRKYDRTGQAHLIREDRLGKYCKGSFKRLDLEQFKALSEFFNVSIRYLLCETDYKTEDTERLSQFINVVDTTTDKNDSTLNLLLTVFNKRRMKLILSLSSARKRAKSAIKLIYENGHFFVIQQGDKKPVLKTNLVNWFINPDFPIELYVSESYKVFNVGQEIELIDSQGDSTYMTFNDFKKMATDIELSINCIIDCRLEYWLKHSDYDSDNDFSNTIFSSKES